MFSINEEIVEEALITLYDSNEREIGGTLAKIKMRFIPQYQVNICGELSAKDLKKYKGGLDTCFIKIRGRSDFIEVFQVRIVMSDPIKFKLRPKEPLILGENKKVHQAKFYLTNINPILRENKIEFGNWIINLKATVGNQEFKDLKKNGGYLITHEGIITKKSSSEHLTRKEANKLTYFLFLLFTFVNGYNTCPFYLRGEDEEGKTIWSQIANNRLDPFLNVDNWFEEPFSDLNQFARGFYNLFQDEIYSDHINEIVYWYVHSNRKGIDKAIILTHTCLELIAWLFLTQDKKNLSKSGFNKLSAADSFSLTLTSCDIPIEIPGKLEELTKLVKGRTNINNACQAFSLLRNKLVHPSSKQRGSLTKSDLLFEAKILGLRFVELFVLYKSNYIGTHFDRVKYNTWRGNVDKVPWA